MKLLILSLISLSFYCGSLMAQDTIVVVQDSIKEYQDSIFMDVKTIEIKSLAMSKKREEKPDSSLYYFIKRELGHNGVFLVNNFFSIEETTVVKPDEKVLSYILNASYLKYMNTLYSDAKSINYAFIPPSKLSWIATDTNAVYLLDTVTKETIREIIVNERLRKKLEIEHIIEPTDTYKKTTPLSDFFTSGLSMSSLLTEILYSMSEEGFKVKDKNVSLSEAAELKTIDDCLKLLILKAKPDAVVENKWFYSFAKYLTRYLTVAKSSDEIVKPRNSREGMKYSVFGNPKAEVIDLYAGANLIGMFNTSPILSVFLGPVFEAHRYEIGGRDSIRTENVGVAVAGTVMIPIAWNMRIRGFGIYYWNRIDFIKDRIGYFIKGTVAVSFEPRKNNAWKYIAPRYEPVGLRCGDTEILSYLWFPSFSYEILDYGSSDREKLKPFTGTLNTTLYVANRLIEANANIVFKFTGDAPEKIVKMDKTLMYKEYGIKLNVSGNKFYDLEPFFKEVKLEIGLTYQEGINLTTGSNDIIKKFTLGIGF